jgi:hypothetical protein
MIQLNDERWKEFEGGYRMPYDASVALKKLEAAESKEEIDEIFKELWNELHHQGDVGLASYFSLPHIIRISKEKKLVDYNVFGFIAVIETERHDNNPKLPPEFEEEYLQAIREGVPDLVKIIIQDSWDATLSSTVMAALAAIKGHIEMAKAILKMEDADIINEFLENY